MTIRKLNESDVETLSSLRLLYAAAFEESDAYASHPLTDEGIRSLLANPQVVFLVAEAEHGAVVGGMTAHLLPSLIHCSPEIYLYDLAVAADYRRRGIATQLIETLREIAQQVGAQSIYVQAHEEDDAAHALYRKLCTGQSSGIIHYELL